MAKYEFCDKSVVFDIRASHFHHRSNHPQKPGVKRIKAAVSGTPRHIYTCTGCLHSGRVTHVV